MIFTCGFCNEPITARPKEDPAYLHRTWATAKGLNEAFSCPNRPGHFRQDRHEPDPETVVHRRRDGLAFLLADGDLRTFSRYGHRTGDCAPVAWRLAYLVAKELGEPVTVSRLNDAMGMVANDHPDVAHIIRNYMYK